MMCSAMAFANDVTVNNMQVRELLPMAKTTAGYFSITNDSTQLITLTGASCDCAEDVQLHQHTYSDDMMKMRRVDEVAIPVGETVTFEPSGYHLMMFKPSKLKLKRDNEVVVTLRFKHRKPVNIKAQVYSLMDESHHSHSHH